MPQALLEKDDLALIGSFVVSHLGHIRHMVELLNSVRQYKDPDHVRKNLGIMEVRDDYVLNLRNVDAAGDTVQEFSIPWRSIRDFLRHIGFENAPFDAMTGAISIAQSLFYSTDDKHGDELLGYYRQREWRITAGYYVNGTPRGRSLVDDERQILMKDDSRFWNRRLSDGKESFHRLDKAVALSEPDPQTLQEMMNRMIVPREIADEVRRLFDDVAIDSI